jgi:putative spermidine/putrescine transport system ATP-binding protein
VGWQFDFMVGLSLEDIHKHFGSVVAVQNVNLHIPHGRFVCFLGPSGCGKTTLLRLIAGLERPTRGRIVLEGKDITEQPAHQRHFGMVFQSLALFPHLSVGDNIAYSLRVRKVDKATCRRRIEELLELVRMPGYADRHITQLSGGQRQRVAMARALAIEPTLFLLDEPLSALDAKLREDMQLELRMLHQRLGVTTILVTHDQREAMTMSDLIVVMGTDNQVHQMGTPLKIYRNPADTFVADFIGTSNLLKGICSGNRQVRVSSNTLNTDAMPGGVNPGSEVTISVRPEEIFVVPGAQEGENNFRGRVTFVRDVGSSVEIYLDCNGFQIISQSTPKARPAVKQGDTATAVLPPSACMVLTSGSGTSPKACAPTCPSSTQPSRSWFSSSSPSGSWWP